MAKSFRFVVNSAQMKRSTVIPLCAMLLASLLGLACKPPRVDLASSRASFEPHDYKDVFSMWSREFQILPVDGVENVLTARATYLSFEFRMGYVARVSYDLRLSEEETAALKERELKALNERHEFFVTVMSGVSKSADLDAEKSNWEIRLKDENGRQVAPVEVTKVKKPTLAEARYFDFENVQRSAYRIYFPLTADDGRPILSDSTGAFTLAFSSALGQGDMLWETKSASSTR